MIDQLERDEQYFFYPPEHRLSVAYREWERLVRLNENVIYLPETQRVSELNIQYTRGIVAKTNTMELVDELCQAYIELFEAADAYILEKKKTDG
jgi:hypothetical protein